MVLPDKIQSMGQIQRFEIKIMCKQMTNAELNCQEENCSII